jgi:hypothetical protein
MNTLRLATGLLMLATLTAGGCSDDPASNNNGPVNVRVLSGVKLSAQASTVYGHLYDVEKDSLYPMNLYTSKKLEIDLIYYYGSSDGDRAAIVTPDYDSLSVGSVGGNYSGYVTDHARVGANVTLFKKLPSFTTAQFDAVNDSATIATAYANGGNYNYKAAELKVGDVVAFRTFDNTDGLFKVTDISSESAAGYITITVKTKK